MPQADFVTIYGSDFGPVSSINSLNATYVNTHLSHLAGKLYISKSCIVTVNHTVIRCASEMGVGFDHKWALTVGQQTGPRSNATTSYAPPAVLDTGPVLNNVSTASFSGYVGWSREG